jgi:hypothetical protein
MSPRIQFDESESGTLILLESGLASPPAPTRQLLDPDWEDSTGEPLMLYVADEPRVGLEFSYHGLDWQIVDYRDGWIARLLVD